MKKYLIKNTGLILVYTIILVTALILVSDAKKDNTTNKPVLNQSEINLVEKR